QVADDRCARQRARHPPAPRRCGAARHGRAGRDLRLRHLRARGHRGRRSGGAAHRRASLRAGLVAHAVPASGAGLCVRHGGQPARRAGPSSEGSALMSRIDLDLAHAYRPNPNEGSDYALLPLKMTFEDGGAYALLGPSGCGKTTLLNICSGLLVPSQGTVSFDGRDVTHDTPQARNIAQVFQFPVIYDTMTVAENLAFPLRNRGVAADRIKQRVGRIAEMLELNGQLDQRAANLAADAKQKISLGRGLVREDVSAVLFDEPLT